MYSKQEAAQLKKEFWTAFGHYMVPVLSVAGEKISWINYKTGEKNIYFRMNADARQGSIAIQITPNDSELQLLYYNQFLSGKKILEQTTGRIWDWQLHTADEDGKISSQIIVVLSDISIYNKKDWPALISFFKNGIMALDEFWSLVKYGFEALR